MSSRKTCFELSVYAEKIKKLCNDLVSEYQILPDFVFTIQKAHENYNTILETCEIMQLVDFVQEAIMLNEATNIEFEHSKKQLMHMLDRITQVKDNVEPGHPLELDLFKTWANLKLHLAQGDKYYRCGWP